MTTAALRGINLISKTTTGAPTTGTWAVGDLVQDSVGTIYRCTVAGTPGTWVEAGGASDFVSPLVTAEVAITTTATLDTTAFGKMHKLSGGTTYTVTLPDATGHAGKMIGFRVDDYQAQYYTLDGNGVQQIGQQATRRVATGCAVVLMARVDSGGTVGWAVIMDTGERAVHVDATSNASQGSLVAGTTNLQYEDEVVDTHAAWATDTFTAPIDGLYLVRAGAAIATTAAAVISLAIFVDGVVYAVGSQSYFPSAGYSPSSEVTASIQLVAGQVVQIRISPGTNVGTRTNVPSANRVTISRISDLI